MTPIIRIGMRYLGVYLAARGFTEAQTLTGDPELIALAESGVGALILAATEGWYFLAKRFGWKT